MSKFASRLIIVMMAALTFVGLSSQGVAQAESEDPRIGWTVPVVVDGVDQLQLMSNDGSQGRWNPHTGEYINDTSVIRNVSRWADWFVAHVNPGDPVQVPPIGDDCHVDISVGHNQAGSWIVEYEGLPIAGCSTPEPSEEPSVTPSSSPSSSPSVTPSSSPTATSTATASPTVKPSASPSATATSTATSSPTSPMTPTVTPSETSSASSTSTTRPSDGSWVYTTPGRHYVNGRQWFTECEPYSQTTRCFTDIWATQITRQSGRYVQTNGWVFNNLTYVESPRSLWANNPLAANGVVGGKINWTAEDGRKWRTECDTAVTGGNGCRSYAEAVVIERRGDSYVVVTKLVFNNIVRFS